MPRNSCMEATLSKVFFKLIQKKSCLLILIIRLWRKHGWLQYNARTFPGRKAGTCRQDVEWSQSAPRTEINQTFNERPFSLRVRISLSPKHVMQYFQVIGKKGQVSSPTPETALGVMGHTLNSHTQRQRQVALFMSLSLAWWTSWIRVKKKKK